MVKKVIQSEMQGIEFNTIINDDEEAEEDGESTVIELKVHSKIKPNKGSI